jgi:hypothetical protein
MTSPSRMRKIYTIRLAAAVVLTIHFALDSQWLGVSASGLLALSVAALLWRSRPPERRRIHTDAMNWPEGNKGRLLAVVYLIAFVAMAIGLAWTIYNQATGGSGTQLTVGIALFVLAQLTITTTAVLLQDKANSTYQQAWHRLSLGLELATAVRALKA